MNSNDRSMNTSSGVRKTESNFVERLVSLGHYRTASEVVRHGLRLLEEAEHRRLLEKWVFQGLSEEEIDRIPPELMDRAKTHFHGLVDAALRQVDEGDVADGPAAMDRLKGRIGGQD